MSEQPAARRGCRYWLRLGCFGIVAFAILAYVGYFPMAIYQFTSPYTGLVCCATPGDHGLAFENVALTDDEISLAGWYIPSQNGAAVILLHGYDASREQTLSQAVMLAEAGYGVLLYDMRGHGESSAVLRSMGWADVADVETAVSWLSRQPDVDPTRIGIFGFSVGGQVALRAAAELDSLQAVVADGPALVNGDDTPEIRGFNEHRVDFAGRVVYWGVALRTGLESPPSIVDEIGRIAPRPLLLIATGAENGMEYRITHNFYEHAADPRAIWHIPETGHGGGPKARPEEYSARLVSFFDAALLP